MFTNNYIKLQKRLFSEYNHSFSFVNAFGETKTCQSYGPDQYSGLGVSMKVARCNELTSSGTYSVMNKVYGVYFGSGATPATMGDYALDSLITSGLTITNPSALAFNDCGNGKYEVAADYVVRNATDAEIVIREVGAFSLLYVDSSYWGGGSDRNWGLALMERTVLETPVTIPAGEARLIEYKVTFNHT